MSEFSLKELYDVRLTADYPVVIGNRTIESGEVIAYFDRIQISNFQEISSYVSAKGGFANKAHVSWQTTNNINFSFSQGVFSETQLSILNNSQIKSTTQEILIPKRFNLESDENKFVKIGKQLYGQIFVYKKETGEKLDYNTYGSGANYGVYINEAYCDVFIDGNIKYTNNHTEIDMGKRLLNGYIHLSAKTKIKDDETGLVRTGIITIPQLKIISNLNLRLGKEATPVTGTFNAIGYPVGGRGEEEVMKIIFLDDDIDSDI